MKSILIILILFSVINTSFSQRVSDLGRMSFYEVKSNHKDEPCDITYGKALSYCDDGGNFFTYIFNNSILNGIMFCTAFPTKSDAEAELRQEVRNFTNKNNIQPLYTGGNTYFTQEGNPLVVMYGVSDRKGTYYLVYYTYLDYDLSK
jgi:hypothetical protein